MLTKIALGLGLIGAASARFFMGECPDLKLMDDFDVKRFTGSWYEQARDK